ncbi:hypothetical protein GCM10010309_78880 [Streptomyces violaceochromogenes]|nr:hypothetical protein GCM10010309_78880 [Streptomyces violaceochromogenes]
MLAAKSAQRRIVQSTPLPLAISSTAWNCCRKRACPAGYRTVTEDSTTTLAARVAGAGQQVDSGGAGGTWAEQDGLHAVEGGHLRGVDELCARGEFGVRVAGDSGDFRSPLDQEADGFPADDAGGPGNQDHD